MGIVVRGRKAVRKMQTRCRAATGGVDVANHGVGVATATPTRSNLTKLGSYGIRFSLVDVVQRDTQQTRSLPPAAAAAASRVAERGHQLHSQEWTVLSTGFRCNIQTWDGLSKHRCSLIKDSPLYFYNQGGST